MAFNKIAAWLLTETGKKFSFCAAGTLSTAVLLGNVLPHTIFIDQYRDFTQLYKKGFSVILSKELKERFEKALDLAEVEPIDKSLFKPFAGYGLEIFSAGSVYSKFGVIVGIPINFKYKSTDNVDRYIIKFKEASIPWETDEGQALLESFILSENAQLYAMAKEIKFRQTPKLFIDTFVSTVSVAGAYGLSNGLNTKLQLYSKPLAFRLLLYCLVGAFTLGSYALCKDASQIYFEEKIDKELKEKSPIFLEGGKEYYGKILQRNVALRKLLGKEGEVAFTALGNENAYLRQKHMPLVQRRAMFD